MTSDPPPAVLQMQLCEQLTYITYAITSLGSHGAVACTSSCAGVLSSCRCLEDQAGGLGAASCAQRIATVLDVSCMQCWDATSSCKPCQLPTPSGASTLSRPTDHLGLPDAPVKRLEVAVAQSIRHKLDARWAVHAARSLDPAIGTSAAGYLCRASHHPRRGSTYDKSYRSAATTAGSPRACRVDYAGPEGECAPRRRPPPR